MQIKIAARQLVVYLRGLESKMEFLAKLFGIIRDQENE
jgi:hypothetical protein